MDNDYIKRIVEELHEEPSNSDLLNQAMNADDLLTRIETPLLNNEAGADIERNEQRTKIILRKRQYEKKNKTN